MPFHSATVLPGIYVTNTHESARYMYSDVHRSASCCGNLKTTDYVSQCNSQVILQLYSAILQLLRIVGYTYMHVGMEKQLVYFKGKKLSFRTE